MTHRLLCAGILPKLRDELVGLTRQRSYSCSIAQPNLTTYLPAMAAKGSDLFLQGESGRSTRTLLRVIILVTIAAAAVASRLFSVIRFESIIHECKLLF